jgi:hypothetical protein
MLCAATSQQYHSLGHHDHINDHTATTRGHTGTAQVLVKTGQCHPKDHWSRIYSRSSFCKPLQNTAIRFNLLQSALQENAIFCSGMLRNASFCFAHTCASVDDAHMARTILTLQHLVNAVICPAS